MVKEPVAEQEKDDVADLLAQAAAQMAQAASSKKNRAAVLKDVEETLSKIKLADFPELAESPIIQAFVKAVGTDDLKPGEVRGKGTFAEREREWTWGDLNAKDKDGNRVFPLKRFTPTETIPITWNGLQLQLIADQECEVPEPFYSIYREHREAILQARTNEAYLLGKSNELPHPNWQTVEGAAVRMWSTQGEQFGKKSGYIGVGPIIDEGGEGGQS